MIKIQICFAIGNRAFKRKALGPKEDLKIRDKNVMEIYIIETCTLFIAPIMFGDWKELHKRKILARKDD